MHVQKLQDTDCLYFTREMLKLAGKDLAGKTVAVSGAGNVAIYAIEKAQQLGAKVVTCSDSTGWVYDPEGIDVAALKEIKEVKTCKSDRIQELPSKFRIS